MLLNFVGYVEYYVFYENKGGKTKRINMWLA